MTIRERRIVIFVIMLIAIAVGLNECGGDFCGAETPITATPSPTTSRVLWSDRQGKTCTKTAWNVLREEFSETASAAIIGNMIYDGTLEPYDEAECEGITRAVMADYLSRRPESAARINLYAVDEIAMAMEEFRLASGGTASGEYGQQKRTDYAKQIYAGYCEDIYTIESVSTAPYDFDIAKKNDAFERILSR